MIRLFAHRGLALNGIVQNSVDSLRNAYGGGFRAVEFDIWFFDGKLLLKHDRPQKSEIKFLPILRDYFSYKNEIVYWMDFKNLDENNAEAALKMVKKEMDKAGVKLEQVYFAPFTSNYKKAAKIFSAIRKIFGEKAQVVAVCKKFAGRNYKEKLRNFLDQNSVKSLSISHRLINKNFMKIFNGIEIFAWTVNNLKTLRRLEGIGAKNFATDKITQAIYDNHYKTLGPKKSGPKKF
jgi:glycerophosphoryl diester phosphodiesterase